MLSHAALLIAVQAQPAAPVTVTLPMPLLAAKLCVVGLMVKDGQLMASAYACAPVQPLASVAVTVKLKVPPAVGVPDIAPPGDKLNPEGNAPALTVKVYGDAPPLAVIVW